MLLSSLPILYDSQITWIWASKVVVCIFLGQSPENTSWSPIMFEKLLGTVDVAVSKVKGVLPLRKLTF